MRPLAGFIWMLFGVTFMSFMTMFAKLVKVYTYHNFVKVAFFRSAFMAIMSYSHGRLQGAKPFDVPPDLRWTLFLRGLFGTASFFFEMWAITLMPVSLAMVLYHTQPIWAAVLGYFFLGEKLNKLDIISIVCCLFGVAIISNPEAAMRFLGQTADEDDQISKDQEEYPYYFWGVCTALFGSFNSGAAYIFMRKIGTRLHTCVKPMAFGIFCAVTCFIVQTCSELFAPAYRSGETVSQFTLEGPAWHTGLLLMTGLCGWLAQEGVSKAISIEKAGRVAVLNYLQIVLCFLFDILFMKRQVHWTDLLGTALIVCFSLFGKVVVCLKEKQCDPAKEEKAAYGEMEIASISTDMEETRS